MRVELLVSALVGWLVQRWGDLAAAGVARAALGDSQQRAFRKVVSAAIKRVKTLGRDQQEFLERVLIEHRESLGAVQHLPDLAGTVNALVESLDLETQPNVVAPPGLADALIAEIGVGALENARSGGPLLPLVADAYFAELFALNAQLRSAQELILLRIAAIEEALQRPGVAVTVHIFTGGWRSLQGAYLDPTEERERVLSEPFTGRDWVAQEISAFVATHDRGYFLIQADAGTGKTAFALWYSGIASHPIHFTQHSADARSTASAVRNLAAQLISIWGLQDLAPGGNLPAEENWSSWLRQVLAAAARKRDTDDPGRPIMLVVDGLDEAVDTDPEHLPLGLPDDLPAGVYVVATVRTGGLQHQPRAPKALCDWNRRSTQHNEDMRRFLTESVQLYLVPALEDDGLTVTEFVSVLLDRCGEVWLYLHFVLAELIGGHCRPRDVPALPRGLDDYYHNTIERFCRDDAEAVWRLRLLATLAIAIEPLDPPTLIDLSGLEDHPTLWRFLDGPLRPFCTIVDVDKRSLKHSSLTEYLTAGPTTDADITDNVQRWRQRLAGECRAAHERICDRYLTDWGGLDEHLPALAADPTLSQHHGGYPLRALAHHLVSAGHEDDLDRLMACGLGDRNVWYAAHESAGHITGFLSDVAAARRAIDRSPAVGAPHVLARKLRYALVDASIASSSTNYPPELLGQLVDRHIWTPTRAFGHVERMTDQDTQIPALIRIASTLPDDLIPRALSLVIGCRKAGSRSRALAAIIPRLPDTLLDEAWRAATSLDDPADIPRAAAAIFKRFPKVRLTNPSWSDLRSMGQETQWGVRALALICRDGPDAAEQALTYVERVSNDFERAQFLAALIPSLPAATFDRALSVTNQCSASHRGEAVVALAKHAPAERLGELFDRTSDLEWDSPHALGAEPKPCPRMMVAAFPRLSPDQWPNVIAFTNAIDTMWRYAEAVEAVAPLTPAGLARQLLREIVQQPKWIYGRDDPHKLIAVAALSRCLPYDEAAPYMIEAFRAAEPWDKRILDRDLNIIVRGQEPDLDVSSAEKLAPIARYLPAATVHRAALRICSVMSNVSASVEELSPALSRLAPWLSDETERELLAVTQRAAVWRGQRRQQVIEILAPHLSDELLQEAAEMTGAPEVEWFGALGSLSHELPSVESLDITGRASALANQTGLAGLSTRAKTAFAAPLAPDFAREALHLVARDTEWPFRTDAVTAVAPHLPALSLPDALKVLMRSGWANAGEIHLASCLFTRLAQEDPEALRDYLDCDDKPGPGLPWDSWLWSLAPYLTPRLAEDALNVARELSDVRGRGFLERRRLHAMAALAPRVSKTVRARVVHEVLELLSTMRSELDATKGNPHRWFADESLLAHRASILARLATASAADEVITACQECLAELAAVTNFDQLEDWNAVMDFLTHIPASLADRALDIYGPWRRLARFEAVRALAPRLPEGSLSRAIACVESEDAWSGAEIAGQSSALAALAKRLPPELEHERHRILSVALNRAVRGGSVPAATFAELLPVLPATLRSTAVDQSLSRILPDHSLEREGMKDLYALMPLLDASDIENLLERLNSVRDPRLRAKAVAAALRRAGELPAQSPTLSGLAAPDKWPNGIGRTELFELIAAAAWWIQRRGGPRCAGQTVEAAFDVVRWWR